MEEEEYKANISDLENPFVHGVRGIPTYSVIGILHSADNTGIRRIRVFWAYNSFFSCFTRSASIYSSIIQTEGNAQIQGRKRQQGLVQNLWQFSLPQSVPHNRSLIVCENLLYQSTLTRIRYLSTIIYETKMDCNPCLDRKSQNSR